MKQVSISELKDQLSKYLQYVRHGEVVTILDRGDPVAEILSCSRKRGRKRENLQALERKGIIRAGNPDKLEQFPYPTTHKESGVLKALLEERRSGR